MSKIKITKDLSRSILASLPVGMLLTTDAGKIVYANPKAEDIFGYDRAELSGHCIDDLIPENHRQSHKTFRDKYVTRPTSIAMSGGRILAGLKKDEGEIALQIGLIPLMDKYTIVLFIETTNEIIKPSSSYDPLTGLPNRRTFDEYSEKLRTLAIRNRKNISVLFVDLDNFKLINDQFGHKIGDMAICEVASLLKKNQRESDIVSRIGGDEFVICLYAMDNEPSLKKAALNLIGRISSITNIQGHQVDINASVGAVICPDPESVAIADLVVTADNLMYKAKKKGKGTAIIKTVEQTPV